MKDFFARLTSSQIKEFEDSIEHLALRVGVEYDFDSTKVAEVNTNMRLDGEIYLYLTILFHSKNGKITGKVIDLVQFHTLDEYLDSINRANSPEAKGKKIK